MRDEQRQTRETRTFYEVRRLREPGAKGVERVPDVQTFYGLDRARLAALGYALDRSMVDGPFYTGRVEVHRLMTIGEKVMTCTLVDVLDERVAFRVLNELSLPRADAMAVSVERLQAETDRLARLGF